MGAEAIGRALAAPLIWLERARGRRRLALALLYGLIVTTAGLLVAREVHLRRVPDIGDPFDPAPLRALRVPDEENAFVLYRQARLKLKRNRGIERRLFGGSYSWPAGDASALAFLEANAEALELWRRGTDRPDALVKRIGVDASEPYADLQAQRVFYWHARVAASKCEVEGRMEATWGWYRALLRACRHAGRHGPVIGRIVGWSHFTGTAKCIRAWMIDPRVNREMVHQALEDTLAAEALDGSEAESVRVEYLELDGFFEGDRAARFLEADRWEVGEIDRTDWTEHLPGWRRLRWFAAHEPERSRRVIRLAFANWLAHWDKPPGRRPPLIGTAKHPKILFAAPTPGGLPPAELAAAVESAVLAKSFSLTEFAAWRATLDRDRAARTALIVDLASRLYELDEGRPPDGPSALVGRYLDRLPATASPPAVGGRTP